jgi:hypothetical protein
MNIKYALLISLTLFFSCKKASLSVDLVTLNLDKVLDIQLTEFQSYKNRIHIRIELENKTLTPYYLVNSYQSDIDSLSFPSKQEHKSSLEISFQPYESKIVKEHFSTVYENNLIEICSDRYLFANINSQNKSVFDFFIENRNYKKNIHIKFFVAELIDKKSDLDTFSDFMISPVEKQLSLFRFYEFQLMASNLDLED